MGETQLAFNFEATPANTGGLGAVPSAEATSVSATLGSRPVSSNGEGALVAPLPLPRTRLVAVSRNQDPGPSLAARRPAAEMAAEASEEAPKRALAMDPRTVAGARLP